MELGLQELCCLALCIPSLTSMAKCKTLHMGFETASGPKFEIAEKYWLFLTSFVTMTKERASCRTKAGADVSNKEKTTEFLKKADMLANSMVAGIKAEMEKCIAECKIIVESLDRKYLSSSKKSLLIL